MELFKLYPKAVLPSEEVYERLSEDTRTGTPLSHGKMDLSNQFVIFQLASSMEAPAILESSQVIPTLKGSEDEPDVLINLEMQSFHLGKGEDVDKDTRATIRINIGKDENSRDKYFETVYWSIAAGLNLYNTSTKKTAAPKELKADFRRAFGNRPIEIPGGLSNITFEVIKHREPKWWEKIFSFINSGTGQMLTSTIGFPAITTQAIDMLDELLNRLDKSNPEILFKSLPLRLALSDLAKQDYTAGIERIKVGCLNQGYCILSRGRDFNKFVNADAVYYPAYGRLIPSSITRAELVSGNFDDPFAGIAYAVFRVNMKTTKLDPNFNYRN